MHDELFDGRPLGVPTVVDTWSRILLRDAGLPVSDGMVIINALEESGRSFGLPHTIQVDQGCQFTSKVLDLWAYADKVMLDFSRPVPSTMLSPRV